MEIKDMFQKPIDRKIAGVIKVGQSKEENKKQELSEYVVTGELTKHFREFFNNYVESFGQSTDEMGVWISGFFGSGKSHFLKILSYILGDEVIDGKHAVEYFSDKENIMSDPMIYANMQRASKEPTLAILFNVDSKSAATAKSDSNAIVSVFNRVFNEKLGYDGANPALADLERDLDEEGKYDLFKSTYKEITGKEWIKDRNKFRVRRTYVKQTLVKMGYMDETAADVWVRESTTQNYQLATEDFAERVHQYIEKTGKRVVFLVDEIGQFISTDSRLMLNLQTLTEELGIRCAGKAWIIVTAQEDIDSLTANMDITTEKKNDFSKIQGRFNTRLSLTSVNADEVIRERILKKNETGEKTLEVLYETNETTIQNVVDFKDSGKLMKKCKNAQEFAADYPFLPYQFALMPDILNSIRLNSSSGRHESEGERSMLGAFQKAAIATMHRSEGALVPLYLFYNDLEQTVDHTHSVVILRAQDNERINPLHEKDCFAVDVLKVLYLLKYVEGVPLTENNIVNFMVTNIHEDKAELRNRVENALKVLVDNLLVSKIQDTYEFLTDEEQDINRDIRDRNIPEQTRIAAITGLVFDSVYKSSRYRVPSFNGRYTYSFNQAVDNQPSKGNQNNPIGLRIITPRYIGSDSYGSTDDISLEMLSARNHEAILKLPNGDQTYYSEITNALKIEDYLRSVTDPQKGKSTVIRATKSQEAGKSKNAALVALKSAIGQAKIFVNGEEVTDITIHDATARIDAALGRLVETIYYKLPYIDKPMDDADIRDLFKPSHQAKLSLAQTKQPNERALQDILDFITRNTGSYNMISLKSLLNQFVEKPPYGYVTTDVKWLVAKLFCDGKLSITIDKEPITRYNRDENELGEYFTNRRYDEKMLIMIKETIDVSKIKDCKTVIHDLFNYSVTDDDPDKVMDAFKQRSTKLQAEVRVMKQEQDATKNLPGREAMDECITLLSKYDSINDVGNFFDTIRKDKDDLQDLAEDIAPVITFYSSSQSTQKQIFIDDGLRPLGFYNSSKEFITDQDLINVVNKISDIVNSKSPYGRIKELPALYKEFVDKYGAILGQMMGPVSQVIDQDCQTVLDRLKGKPYEAEFAPSASRQFTDLKDRAERESNISDLLGYKYKADSLCTQYLNKIETREQQIAKEKKKAQSNNGQGQGNIVGQVPVQPTTTKIENAFARNLLPGAWYINSEADIDKYVEGFRRQLKEQLKGNDQLIIHFD